MFKNDNLRKAGVVLASLFSLAAVAPAASHAEGQLVRAIYGNNISQCDRGAARVIYTPGFNSDVPGPSYSGAKPIRTLINAGKCVWVYRYGKMPGIPVVGVASLKSSAQSLATLVASNIPSGSVDMVSHSEGAQVVNYAATHFNSFGSRVRKQVGFAGLTRPVYDIHDLVGGVLIGTNRINLFAGWAGYISPLLPSHMLYFADLASKSYWQDSIPGITTGLNGKDHRDNICYLDMVSNDDLFFGAQGRGDGARHRGAPGEWHYMANVPGSTPGIKHVSVLGYDWAKTRMLNFINTAGCSGRTSL